jgi:hypothetical protein
VKLEPDETVVLAWIVYESREHRDRVNEQVMNDPRIANMDPKSMPFDTKRMFWGGFTVFVDKSARLRIAAWPVDPRASAPPAERTPKRSLDERRALPRTWDLRAARALLDQLA